MDPVYIPLKGPFKGNPVLIIKAPTLRKALEMLAPEFLDGDDGFESRVQDFRV